MRSGSRHDLPTEKLKPERDGKFRALLFWDGGFAEVPLKLGMKLRIGRAAECDLVIEDSSVSRSHAMLDTGPPLTVRDLGSANGTRIDGAAVSSERPTPVRPGALIEIGDAVIVVRGGSQQMEAVSDSGSMAAVRELVTRVARGNIPVTLMGETGVGKELLAERLHAESPRAERPFVRINCAALPEQLLESELFGYERGAFTGAAQAKAGLLESADGGTVFLDEVGDLPKPVQAKLLRALECKEVFRIGALKPRSFDVRFVAATNRDLEEMVETDDFRRDLFHRLCGVVISVPPLRERPDELEALAKQFVNESARELDREPPTLSPTLMATLSQYDWPGNIRELRHVMQAAVLVCRDATLEPSHLPPALRGQSTPVNSAKGRLRNELDEVEKRRILDALEQCGGNQTRAAALLGIPRRTLITRISQYGIPRPRKKKR